MQRQSESHVFFQLSSMAINKTSFKKPHTVEKYFENNSKGVHKTQEFFFSLKGFLIYISVVMAVTSTVAHGAAFAEDTSTSDCTYDKS